MEQPDSLKRLGSQKNSELQQTWLAGQLYILHFSLHYDFLQLTS